MVIPRTIQRILAATAVAALVACGGGGSSQTQGTGTTTPTTPTTGTSTATYTFSWTAVSDSNVTGYKVYYGTSSFATTPATGYVSVTPATASSVDFTPANYNIASGTTLYMGVTSVDASGDESAMSNVATVTVQ